LTNTPIALPAVGSGSLYGVSRLVHVLLFRSGDAGENRRAPDDIERQVNVARQFFLFAHEQQIAFFLGRQRGRAAAWPGRHGRPAGSRVTAPSAPVMARISRRDVFS
jgi:hypothetical protein